MPKEETTTKFKADISELKAAMQEASRMARLANSEFKAATAGMNDWAKNADGLTAKLKSLHSVFDAEKTKLESLKKQYEFVVKEQGENSRGAQELAIKINNQQAAVNRVESEIRKYNSALNDLEREQKESATAVKESESAYNKLKAVISEQENQLSKLKGAYSAVAIEQGEGSDEAQRLAKEIEELSGELKENKDVLADAEKAADGFDKSLEDIEPENAAGGFTILKGAIADLVADGIRMAISALQNFVKESINIGKEFDSSMSEVAAISGATGEDLQKLRDTAKEFGETTVFSAAESAEALKYMAMAGWKTTDMIDGLEGVINLAAASGEDLGTTSDIVTDSLTAFGLSASDSGHFADVLAKAASNANTNVSMMGETFKYVAPVAGALGFSAEDTALATGLMANSGIKASQAGTTLRAALTSLVKPSKEASNVMVQLGLATEETAEVIDDGKLQKAQLKVENKTLDMQKAQVKYNEAVSKYGAHSSQAQTAALNLEKAENALKEAVLNLNTIQEGQTKTTGINNQLMVDSEGKSKSLKDVLLTLRSAFQGLSEEEQTQAATALFGQEAMSGMLAIINASNDDFNNLAQAIESADGAAKEMADVMNDNLNGDLRALHSKLEGIQIALYEKFEPALRAGVEILSKLLDALDWAVENLEGFAPLIAGVAAAFGVLAAAMAIQGLINGVSKAFAFLNLTMAANPIVLIAAAIAGLVVAFVTLWNKSESFRNFWIGLWDGIKNACSAAVEGIKNIFNGIVAFFTETIPAFFSGVIDWFKNNWQSLLLMIVNPFAGAFKLIYDNCDGFREFVDNFVGKVKDIFVKGWNAIVNFFTETIPNCISNIIKWFEKLPYNIGYILGLALGKATSWGKDMIAKAKETGQKFINNVVDFFKQLPSKAYTHLTNTLNNEKKWASDMAAKAKEAGTNFLNSIVAFFKELPGKVQEWLKSTLDKITTWVSDTVNKAKEAGKGFLEGVSTFFRELPGKIWEWLSSSLSKLGDWVSEMGRKGLEGAKKFLTSVVDGIKAIPGEIVETGKNIVKGLWEGITGAAGWLKDKIKEFAKGITDGLKDALKIKSPSQVMANEVGRWIPAGIAEGIEDNAKSAINAAKNLSKKIVPATEGLKARLSGSASSIKGKLTNDSTNAQQNVTYNFYQTNNSPKALSRLDIYRQTNNQLRYAKAVRV